MDLSPQAVEITQLALWIRSARRGKTLADLSQNIVWGNSLVTDPAVHPQAMHWEETFPEVFARAEQPGLRLRDRQSALGAAEAPGAGVLRLSAPRSPGPSAPPTAAN